MSADPDASPLTVLGPVLSPGTPAAARRTLHVREGRVVAEPPPGASLLRLPRGAVVLPGFVDPHLHLLASAAARLSLSLEGMGSIAEILRAVGEQARRVEPGGWVRAHGYETFILKERRAPDREELDAVSAGRMVVLHERSGHELACNSAALDRLGLIGAAAPQAGVEQIAGRATGRVRGVAAPPRSAPALDPAELRAAVGAFCAELLAEGVTALTDAGPHNGPGELSLLAELGREGVVPQRLEAMVGLEAVDHLRRAGLGFGSRLGEVSIGHVKLIAEAAGAPPLHRRVAAARAAGWPVAIHALEPGTLQEALDAIALHPPPPGLRDRLEHVALSLPEQLAAIAASGAAVVTQPAFLVRRRRKYLQQVGEIERPWLYRVGSLLAAGVTVAASSDSPVVPPRPAESIAGARWRGFDGAPIGPAERVDADAALRLVTEAAGSVGTRRRGTLEVGAPADFVVLERDPRRGPLRVLATFVGGARVFGELSLDPP